MRSLILGSGLAESLDSLAELFGYRELGALSLGPVRTLGLGLGTRSSYRLSIYGSELVFGSGQPVLFARQGPWLFQGVFFCRV